MIKHIWLYALRYAMTRPTGAMLSIISEDKTDKILLTLTHLGQSFTQYAFPRNDR